MQLGHKDKPMFIDYGPEPTLSCYSIGQQRISELENQNDKAVRYWGFSWTFCQTEKINGTKIPYPAVYDLKICLCSHLITPILISSVIDWHFHGYNVHIENASFDSSSNYFCKIRMLSYHKTQLCENHHMGQTQNIVHMTYNLEVRLGPQTNLTNCIVSKLWTHLQEAILKYYYSKSNISKEMGDET